MSRCSQGKVSHAHLLQELRQENEGGRQMPRLTRKKETNNKTEIMRCAMIDVSTNSSKSRSRKTIIHCKFKSAESKLVNFLYEPFIIHDYGFSQTFFPMKEEST
jgi:hypothetical protein